MFSCACVMCVEEGASSDLPLLQIHWSLQKPSQRNTDYFWPMLENFFLVMMTILKQFRHRSTERMKCKCGFWTGNHIYHEAGAVPVTAEIWTPPISSLRFAEKEKITWWTFVSLVFILFHLFKTKSLKPCSFCSYVIHFIYLFDWY